MKTPFPLHCKNYCKEF